MVTVHPELPTGYQLLLCDRLDRDLDNGPERRASGSSSPLPSRSQALEVSPIHAVDCGFADLGDTV